MDSLSVLILAGIGLIVIVVVVVVRSRQTGGDFVGRQGPYGAPPASKPIDPQPSRPASPPAPPVSTPPQQAPAAPTDPSTGVFDLDLEAETVEPEEAAPAQKKGGLVGSVIDAVSDAIKDVVDRDEEPETREGRKRRKSEILAEEPVSRQVSEATGEREAGAEPDEEASEGAIPRMKDIAPEEAPPEPAPPPKPAPVAGKEEQAKQITFEDRAPEETASEEAEPDGEEETRKADAKPEAPDDPVQFSAYYPREAQAGNRYGLYVYAHLEALKEAVREDVEKFKDELGGEVEKPKVAKQTPRLKRGTAVTVTPECEELTFDPPSLTKTWEGDWTRYGFDFRPGAALIDETLFIRVSIQVSGIEIAHIKCAVDVVAASAQPEPTAPENPLAAAQLQVQQAALYEKIFVSYSRRDKVVVESYRLAQIARGDEVFMDTYSIRAGEDWQAALANAIAEADIFQLFWSANSAVSENVKDEWEYAMTYRCPDTKCAAFIRPVYWVNPWPPPPAELSHLNFRFVPLQESSDAQ